MVYRVRCSANPVLAYPFYNRPAAHVRISNQCQSPFSLFLVPSPRQQQRCFSTTPPTSAENQKTHYEVLGVQHSASAAEIKKSFYALSRSTHPDIHPNDPDASRRFSEISESYHVLSDPEKRSRYDRDVIHPLHHRHRHHYGHSHSSGGAPAGHTGSYAGSRPASGLSKRRGTFRGPPPSFYAQGGYGGSSRTTPDPSSSTSSTDDFNPEPTRRTQAAEDTRRQSRRQAALAEAQASAAEAGNFWVRVVVVLSILVGAGAVGGLITTGKSGKKQKTNGGTAEAEAPVVRKIV